MERHRVPWIIIIYKAVSGLLELILGVGFILIGTKALQLYNNFIARELIEDNHRFLIKLAEWLSPAIFNHHTALSVYLIIFGITKIIGAVGLAYKKHWGVDLLIAVTVIFLPVQLYNLVFNHSLSDLIYLIISLFIALYLINFNPEEYSRNIINKIKNNNPQ